MRYICICLLMMFVGHQTAAQDAIAKRIVLIGNAGAAVKENNGFLEAVKRNVQFDSNTIVLYLGNNVVPGTDTEALLMEAGIIGNSLAKAFFIPGFKDWANGDEAGYAAIMKQQRLIDGLGNDRIKFYPGDGCPGPKKIDLGHEAVMFIMDSQWWLHEHNKPNIESDCKYRTDDEILAELEDIPKDHYDKLILFVSHHPAKNTGVHSGTFGLKQHIFPFTDVRGLKSFYLPLPIIGSLYPVTRNSVISKQDMNHPTYEKLSEVGIRSLPGIKEAFKDHPHTIFISGQEHNLQLLKEGQHSYIISGGGSKISSRVRKNQAADYAEQQAGFAVLEILENKKVRTRFYEIDNGIVKESHVNDLMDYSKIPPFADDTAKLGMIYGDSTIAIVDEELGNMGGLRRLLNGKNHREEWGTPVKMKVFHLDTEKGGLKIKGIGGGHESKSLQLEDANGTKWVLRSMNKNLEAVIPEGFQGTAASDLIHDMLCGVHPYGALIVPGLQEPLNIVHAKPELYFVPNDTALGIFRPLFANSVCQMEERKPAINDNELVSSNEAFNDMISESDHLSDQHTYLKIRLVDFLIADFDRHHGQYTWGTIDTEGRKLYYPIPKDRDQALYHNTGFLMKIARKRGFSFMVNLPYTIKSMRKMGYQGAYVDMVFMNKLTEKDWNYTLTEFRNALSDTVIHAAVQRMPSEIYAIRGPEINARLASRRTSIADKGLDYYRFISTQVNVLGGNKDEVFKVTSNDSGLLVEVYAKQKDGENQLRYTRNFDPAVTKEIRLFGFNGNDYFDVDEKAKSRIRLQIVGGKGNDTFDIKGRVKNHIYDLVNEDNEVLARARTTKMFSRDAKVNEYAFRENLYGSLRFPVTFGFNDEDGVLAGIGLSHKTTGFRKYPYAARHRISTLFALSKKAYQVKYYGELVNVYRKFGLVFNGEFFDPVLSNFFGLGNETVRDASKPVEYYRTRYDYLAGDVLVRKRFLNDSIMSFSAGPSFYRYWLAGNSNQGKILETPSVIGLDSNGVYSRKSYVGGKALFTVNNLNSEMVPVRGINWTTEFTALGSLNASAHPFTSITSTMNLYAVLSAPTKLLAALHFGGGHILNDKYEYFQSFTLGGNNYLRGFRINRFAGSSMAYGSAELKMKLFDFNAYVVKGDFGLVGFNDLGRVWVKGEQSQKWHHGYGGGIYMIPFNSLMVSAVAAFSEEDKLFNLTVGTNLNMVFQGRQQ